MENEPILIWWFKDAPKELQDLSNNGGDEDWLAVIPPSLLSEWIPWMQTNSGFGYCCVDEYDHPSKPGYKVRIGSHS